MPTLASRLAAVLAALAVLQLAGCTHEANRHEAAGTALRSSARPTTSDLSDPGSAGVQRVESSGVAFEMPEGWRALKAEELLEGVGGDNPAVADLADRFGLTPEQLVQAMGSIDLFMFSPSGGHHGFVDNVNVLSGAGSPPNESQVELQLLQLGAQDYTVDTTTTAAGATVITTSYHVEIAGHDVLGGQLFLEVPDGVATVTVSTSDGDLTQRLVDEVLDSIELSDPETS